MDYNELKHALKWFKQIGATNGGKITELVKKYNLNTTEELLDFANACAVHGITYKDLMEAGKNRIKTANGYIIEKYNERGYILTRKTATLSNYFVIIDNKPVFESTLFVNDFTRKLIKKVCKAEKIKKICNTL